MSALDEGLKLLGASTPLVYAAATFGLFHWLDKKASPEARTAIVGTLANAKYDDERITSAIVASFDQIYGRPLWSWYALGRSAICTIVIIAIYFFEIMQLVPFYDDRFPLSLFLSILSDYASLFVIRKVLVSSVARPVFSLVAGFVVAALIVLVSFIARSYAVSVSELGLGLSGAILRDLKNWVFFPLYMLIPAIAVFFWLPLYGVSILLLRAIGPVKWAVGKVLWLLKDGEKHPFDGIGYVAGAIVFVITAVWQVLF
jgi:hypothetical protein